MGLEEQIQGLKDDIENIGTQGVMAAALPEAPWLKLPVIKQVATFMISKVLQFALDKTELGAFIIFTVQRKAKESTEYKAAAVKLENAPKGITDAEKKKLQQAKIDAARKLIKFTPND